jgi:hydroxypyruvate isomerase
MSSVRAGGTFRFVANVSLLFAEAPFLERFGRAKSAGFGCVESWWPFGATPSPSAADIDAFVAAIADAGVEQTGMNLFAGDMPAGERGVLSRPDREDEFLASLDAVLAVAERTGCHSFNALYGQRVEGFTAAEQDETAVANVCAAIDRLAGIGGTLFIEPLARGLNGRYPIETAAEAASVVAKVRQRSNTDRIALLFDTFHLAHNGEDLVGVIDRWTPLIGHVQLADSPGRGAPGTGAVDFTAVLNALWDAGYRGSVAAEYMPGGDTLASLEWVRTAPHLSLA